MSPARPYSRAERVADAAIHIIGLAFAIGAAISLAILVLPNGGWLKPLAVATYLGGLFAMIGCSALYNLSPEGRWKARFRRLDHAAIFVMIAGTYTPFTLVAIGGVWGIGLFAFVWSVAIAGVALKLFWPGRMEKLSILAYLAMGWSILAAIQPLIEHVSTAAIILLAVGGLLYSLGVIFHFWERLKFQNAVWHGFVVAAASCHFAAVVVDVA
ncbi:PAQR family membrane homeostasis protein TrhA [Minwuia sp.]|uniref:PAQR family membrane homeostasis protein TrhA n=1 Tax=Minwuia sp. TaxID=2493630 RepID=UPI003A8E2909